MNAEQLAALGKNAALWAKCYVQLKEALVREGVLDEEARAEARTAANMAALYDQVKDGEDCPLCGR